MKVSSLRIAVSGFSVQRELNCVLREKRENYQNGLMPCYNLV